MNPWGNACHFVTVLYFFQCFILLQHQRLHTSKGTINQGESSETELIESTVKS